VSDGRDPIRSYQRIFRPERRIYHLEGRALPVPGGIPLRWLGYLVAALLAVLAIGSDSWAVAFVAATGAATAGGLVGGRVGAIGAGIVAVVAVWVLGVALGVLDWPLRLIVLPIAIATLATQATPDGRHASRFAISWLALRLEPRRQSIGRPMPAAAVRHSRDAGLWVSPDESGPRLRRARVRGTGVLRFAEAVRVRRRGLRQRHLSVRGPGRTRRGELAPTRFAVGDGEIVELRP
jgi:hypothetical protein